MKKCLTVLFLVACIICPAAEKPGVIWCSTPVRPGEAVMVYGGEWGKSPQVELSGGKMIVPLQVNDTTVSFIYPQDMAMGIVKGKITADGQSSREFELNSPAVWWLQGDWGKEASPGGWLRAFGRCMAFDNKGAMTLKGNGKTINLKLTGQDCWSLNAALPSDLAAGEYEVLLRNGLGAETYPAGKLTIKAHAEVWKTKVYNAVDYGAVANDGFDDTVPVKAALEAIKTDGGGILHFPRGRYQINGMLEIPPYTLLKGEGRELSQLYWPDTDTPPVALIKGTHSFGIEDLFLSSGLHRDGIVAEGDNITLRKIRMRMSYSQYLTPEEATRRISELTKSCILKLHGNFIRVVDSDLYAVGAGSFGLSGKYIQVTNNIFGKGSTAGSNNHVSGNYLIVDGNRLNGCQLTSFGSVDASGTRNVYWGNNFLENTFDGNNQESFTCDGGVPCYKDTAESVNGTELQLKKFGWRFGADYWKEGYVQLVAGKGAGQIRKIAKIDGTKVTVDQPWEIQPDAKTYIVIAAFRQHFIYVNNETNDSSIAMQLYGSMIDAIIANNKTSRTGGFHNYGMTKGGSPEVNWFVQYFDNQILEGNGYRGPMNEIPALDAHIAIRDRGVPKELGSFPITRACLMRRNVLNSNARIEIIGGVDSALVENSLVKNSDVGISVEAAAKNIILRGNRFENVKQPYLCGSNTLITPSEKTAEAVAVRPQIEVIPVTDFLVAGPFENKSGKSIDSTVHPPEFKLDVTANYPTRDGKRGWVPVKADKGGTADLSGIFKTSSQSVAHAVAVLRAAKPVQILLRYSASGSLCYVNGYMVGTTMQRGQWGCVTLKKGDNVLQLITTNDGSPEWKMNIKFTVFGPLSPGELTVVPAEELPGVTALKPPAGDLAATGKNIPNSQGIDWQLVLDDNFNRKRVGSHLTGYFSVPHYIRSGIFIENGTLQCDGGAGVFTYDRKVQIPLRIEFDVKMEKERLGFGVMLGEQGRTRFMFDDKLRHGYQFNAMGINNQMLLRNAEVISDGRKGVHTLIKPEQWNHVVFQFIPPHCQFYFNGKAMEDYSDKQWIAGLDEIAIWGVPGIAIDNLRIYTGKENIKP
ncbi:MAG: glycosyl hydrolase family 28-related protein [Victivallales bacterium]